ncbi:MAG: hypothetical protein C0522_05705 [Rhodocyclaceae bacterium]|nr:hypothetical protein [Rhodocyclaceae bacterium]
MPSAISARRVISQKAESGTVANSLAPASLCQSYHSVICHELAHVETDFRPNGELGRDLHAFDLAGS